MVIAGKLRMNRTRLLIAVLSIAVACLGCTVIAGKEDSGAYGQGEKQIRLTYVATLRNQASLRTEAFRDVLHTTGTPTTLQLQRPYGVYADAFRVYVTDQTQPARIFIFDRGERTVRVLAIPAPPAEGKLLSPTGIVVDSTNVIYVADAPQGRVFGYDLNGTLLTAFGKLGDLSHPLAVAFDKRWGRIYVADSHAHLVKVFNLIGERLPDIGADGPVDKRLRSPVALALDKNGRLYVLDGQRKHVYLFDEGKFINRVPLSQGAPGGSPKPRGLAVDSAGHIYVADSVNNNILIFESDGSFLMTWGKSGFVRGDFLTPQGLFIDERDQIYIADQTNGRIQVYQFQK